MVKKRTTLDAVLPNSKSVNLIGNSTSESLSTGKLDGTTESTGQRSNVSQQSLYLKRPVHRQLRVLAFEEEKKMHDLYLEALDLLFINRGLPSIDELIKD